MWVDQETLDIISTFIGEGGLDHIFTEVGPSSDLEVFPPEGGIKGYLESMMYV